MNMQKDKYIYPAVFTYNNTNNDAVTIELPDLPGCSSSAENTDKAIWMAKDAMGSYLYHLEKNNESIPEPSNLKEVKTEQNRCCFMKPGCR
jgi:predicted RNase H-like HicB family nuclease